MSSLKQFFIPHAENQYHPHLLHTKRAVLYSGLFVAMKAIVIAFVLLVPAEVYVLPDVLANQEQALYRLTNDVRGEYDVPPLSLDPRLFRSAQAKAQNMADEAYFSHESPEGKTLADWLTDAEYPYHVAGENLAIGFSDPRALMSAWGHSPTHFANLIDTDYEDIGISLASGEYQGVPVVYAVQHFGTKTHGDVAPAPIVVADVEATADTTSVPAEVSTAVSPEDDEATHFGDVLGVKETEEAELPQEIDDPTGITQLSDEAAASESLDETAVVDLARSSVRYTPVDDTHITLIARAGVNVPYQSAVVTIGGVQIPLRDEETYGVVSGAETIHESVDTYFEAVLVPQLRVVTADGNVVTVPLRWERIPKVDLTPVETYTTSRSLLSPFTPLFDITSGIYVFFILLFSIALLLHIAWEYTHQHHHITIQTLGLILLLITLAVV